MLKHKTSVLFVNTDGKGKKTIQIPTLILLNWRKYLIAAVSIFLLMGLAIGFFIYEHAGNYYTNMYKEKLVRANQIKNAIDIDKAKQSFESIDKTMDRLNLFMKNRGLAPLELANAGGPLEFDITEINEFAEFYSADILRMEDLIKTMPIGKPHEGEQTSHFGVRHNPFGGRRVEGHKGIDIKGDHGSDIKSTAQGVVVFAGTKGGYGNCVIIAHKNKFKTLYGHLSKIDVKVGQKVQSGEVIGKLGSTGRSTGPHVHYEIWKNNERINPQEFLKL